MSHKDAFDRLLDEAKQNDPEYLKQQLLERDALIEDIENLSIWGWISASMEDSSTCEEMKDDADKAFQVISKAPSQALEEHNTRLRGEVARECLELIETTWEQMDEKIRDREFNDTIANDTVRTCFVWMKRAIRNKHLTESEEG